MLQINSIEGLFMQKVANVEKIINEIEYLEYSDQIELLGKLVDVIKNKSLVETKLHTIKELRGLGKEIWTEINIENYINEQRNSWE